eukprot:jgi/Hompol1/3431/HPOL_006584-RA
METGASRRLLKELHASRKAVLATALPTSSSIAKDSSHVPEILLEPESDSDLYHWRATFAGTSGSPYAGGRFTLSITVPEAYPMQPPAIRFVTKVCHPNVNFETGEICLDLLKTSWSPAWTLQSACAAIALLMTNPAPESPLNCDAANLLRAGDIRGYNSLVSMFTMLHASPSDGTGLTKLDQ